jgi:CheY-like chemotaxis protein
MRKTDILWLDDDSPDRVDSSSNIRVITAQSCSEADKLIESGKVTPRWAVIDLIVPQGTWGKPAQRLPGIEFIQHLKEKFGDKIGIVAYSIVMPPELAEIARAAGAEKAIAKPAVSWSAILDEIEKQL